MAHRAEGRPISFLRRWLNALRGITGRQGGPVAGDERPKAAPKTPALTDIQTPKTPPTQNQPAPRVVIRAAERAAIELPPPAAVTPRMVAAPPADFSGRAAEIAELSAAAEGGARVISLQGMAGVGKTTLALRLAAELAPRGPDGALWLDLRGSSPAGPLPTAEALGRLLLPFYPASVLPGDESELAGLLARTFENRRMVVVIDDAPAGALLAQLLPPAPSLTIVTSREAPKLPEGCKARYLAPLRPADAESLLAGLAPGLGSRAAEAAKGCGCLPFVLRFAGWALADRLDLDSTEFARRLTESRRGGALADGALAMATELLSDNARRLWLALSAVPGSFEPAAAAALGGLREEPARAALAELVKAGLAVAGGAGGRLRLHELARAHAEGRRSDAERAEGRLRHAVYSMGVLRRAEKLCAGTGDEPAAGLALLDAEWENISVAQAFAAAAPPEDDTLDHLACDFPTAGEKSLALRRSPRERILWLEAALAAARRLELRATECNYLAALGTLHAGLDEHGNAVARFEEYLAASSALADRRGECAVLGMLAAALRDSGRADRAAETWRRQLELARTLGDGRAEASALGNLALASTASGDHRGAREVGEQHLAAVRAAGDRKAELAALGTLGAARAADGDAARAAECFERQAALAAELGDARAEGVALANLSAIAGRLGEPRRAIACHERLLAFARKSGDRAGELSAAGGLAAACHALGEHSRAAGHLKTQAELAHELGDNRAECAALGNQAVALRSTGNHLGALEAGERHLALARTLGDRRAEAVALAGLGQSHAALGEHGRAAERYEEHLSVLRSAGPGAPPPAPATLGAMGYAYFQTGDNARAAKCYEEQLAAARAAGDRRSEGNALYNLGLALDRLGDRAGAITKLEEALAVYQAAGDASAKVAAEQLARWKS